MLRTEQYKELRRSLIEFLAENQEPTSPRELSHFANRLDAFAREFDAIAGSVILESEREFSAVPRDTEGM